MPIYVNRVLNLKKIQVIGFDMDHTLVRYRTREFETLAHAQAARILVEDRGYPAELKNLEFDYQRSIVGLVIDTRNGNLLQLSRFGKVKSAYHGLKEIHYRKVKDLYANVAVDLDGRLFIPLDTNFAKSFGVLYSQLVELKNEMPDLPDFATIARDVGKAIDLAHRDGSIKDVVRNNLEHYIIDDPEIALMLERYVDYGKKLMIITNSDYSYTREILDYAITPHLRKHGSWRDVFDIVITLADKPRFFQDSHRFLRVDPDSGAMHNHEGSVAHGVFQGGGFRKLQDDLGLRGNEILYLGDHIYGDVVAIKKLCDWRTGLVLADLEEEIRGIEAGRPIQNEIDALSQEKSRLEQEINTLDIARYEGRDTDEAHLNSLYEQIEKINNRISELLGEYRGLFNPYWGEVLRAGMEESRYADQLVRYACVYMTKISDLWDYSPKTYFRPMRRSLPHELQAE
jgi:HAD superfamily 5'-nucleotidase-like hydrolase